MPKGQPSRSIDERGTFGPSDEDVLRQQSDAAKTDKPVNATRLRFLPKQEEFFSALRSEKFLYLLYGGAIRSGKSSVGLLSLIMLCKVFPGSRWAVVRREGTTLVRNTIPSFNRLRPPQFITAPNGKGVARCANGSEIIFFAESLDIDPDYDRWKGLEVNGFLLEEANELAEGTFVKAQERAGSWKLPSGKRQPMPYILLTCNPSKTWIYTRFYLPWSQGQLEAPYLFIKALPSDNTHNPPEYIEALKNMPPQAYDRFVKGNWEALDEPDQLIHYEWLLKATKDVPHVPGANHLGVDVARFGDDYSCRARRNGNALVELTREHGLRTTRLGELVCSDINDWPVTPENVRVDVVGLGAGTVDYCHSQFHMVQSFNSGERSPTDPRYPNFQFKNKRSWAWWHMREELRLGHVAFLIKDYSRLFQDLAAPKYWISGDKTIEVESKDSMKKRLGRSPDEGDAVVMAWAEDPHAVGALDLSSGKEVSAWRFGR